MSLLPPETKPETKSASVIERRSQIIKDLQHLKSVMRADIFDAIRTQYGPVGRCRCRSCVISRGIWRRHINNGMD